MVYVRGAAKDFDTWEAMGAAGWGFRHVLPYYRRMEDSHGGEEGWRGRGGPLHVTRGLRANPLYQAFVDAGREAGYPVTADYNGRQQEGFGAMEMTVWKGRRWSAASAYLRPALKRGNVALKTRALARRVVFQGKRAVGVEFSRAGVTERADAAVEVILSAGAIGSPHILQLSGVGDAEHLAGLGIPVQHELRGVGRNFQDHFLVRVQAVVKDVSTLACAWPVRC